MQLRGIPNTERASAPVSTRLVGFFLHAPVGKVEIALGGIFPFEKL